MSPLQTFAGLTILLLVAVAIGVIALGLDDVWLRWRARAKLRKAARVLAWDRAACGMVPRGKESKQPKMPPKSDRIRGEGWPARPPIPDLAKEVERYRTMAIMYDHRTDCKIYNHIDTEPFEDCICTCGWDDDGDNATRKLRRYRGKGPIVLHEASDLPGLWVSHDLSTDIVSQGDTPAHALEMLHEAVGMYMDDDDAVTIDPRPEALADDWPPGLHRERKISGEAVREAAQEADAGEWRLRVDQPRPGHFEVSVGPGLPERLARYICEGIDARRAGKKCRIDEASRIESASRAIIERLIERGSLDRKGDGWWWDGVLP